jgi:hypothetical protein
MCAGATLSTLFSGAFESPRSRAVTGRQHLHLLHDRPIPRMNGGLTWRLCGPNAENSIHAQGHTQAKDTRQRINPMLAYLAPCGSEGKSGESPTRST